jgi:hypothetical protein
MQPPPEKHTPAHGEEEAKHGTAEAKHSETQARASNTPHAHGETTNHGGDDSDDNYSDDPKSRTSASSRVNFSKLTAEEKERRCHNMSKEVKQLRRKIRNMEERLARSGGRDSSHAHDGDHHGGHENAFHIAKEKLHSAHCYELPDQRDLMENLANFVAQERLKPDSLPYYMICTLVRGCFTPEEWKQK